jgi:hypothetical protein
LLPPPVLCCICTDGQVETDKTITCAGFLMVSKHMGSGQRVAVNVCAKPDAKPDGDASAGAFSEELAAVKESTLQLVCGKLRLTSAMAGVEGGDGHRDISYITSLAGSTAQVR